jgi:phosphatidylinositol alpha-mannosyltransferase
VRILLVSPYDFPYPGGVTEHVTNLDREFRSRGHEVTITAPSSAADTVDRFPNFHPVGSRIVPLPVNQSTARLTLSPALLPRVRRFLEEHEFDIVHLHEPLLPALPLTVLRYSRSVNVGTFHAARRSAWIYRTTRPLIRRLQSRLTGKIAVSESARDLVHQSYRGEYRIIPNGIDVDFYDSEVEPFPHLADGLFNILFLGRLEKRKGPEYLLRAMQLVQQLRPRTRLVVVGGFRAGRRRAYQRQVDELGLKNVMFEGFVSNEDKLRYLKSCHSFCSPALGGESQGVVLLEAMASGVPVVASDIPGYRSVLLDGEGALLIPPKDHVALARNLMRIIDNADKREKMIAFGLRRAADFAWGTIATRVLAYYQELLNEDEIGGKYWSPNRALSGATGVR